MYKYFLAFVLCLVPSACFAQAFIPVRDATQYPSRTDGNVIPLNKNQAILSWRREPRNSTIVSVSIIPSFVFKPGIQGGIYGWYEAEGTDGVDGFTHYYTVIDASHFYSYAGDASTSVMNVLQTFLVRQNLGTVAQRQAYINQLHGTLDLPQLIDPGAIFQGVIAILQPYAVLMISIFGSIFVLGRCLKIFEAHINARRKLQVKIEKRAERTAQLNDQEFGRISFNLDMLAAQYKETGSRADRRAYREAFREYAAYKESKGWKY